LTNLLCRNQHRHQKQDAATHATQAMTTAWEELFDAAFATMTHKETQNGNHFQHHLQSHWPHEIVYQSDSRGAAKRVTQDDCLGYAPPRGRSALTTRVQQDSAAGHRA